MRAKLGVIGGSSFLEDEGLALGEPRTVDTALEPVTVREGEGFVFLARHGVGSYRAPHRIPHAAHALALEALGVGAVVGLNSAGALDPALAPGSVVVPDDYLSVHPPPTLAGDARLHIVPELDPGLRRLLLRAGGPDAVDGGVYVQTSGPRFETRAEIRWLRTVGDVVGMTAASEATLCQELGLRYAMLSVVDNYAHGVVETSLTFEAYESQRLANVERVHGALGRILDLWREGEGA